MNITPLGAAGEVTSLSGRDEECQSAAGGRRFGGELLEWFDSLAGARPRVVITQAKTRAAGAG